MKVLNNEFSDKMKKLGKDRKLELTDEEYECYSNCFYVIYLLTGEKYSFEDIFELYDFFTDVLDGRVPDVEEIDYSDAYKGFYKLSLNYYLTKDLNDIQRSNMCFAIYYAACVMTYDEKNNEMVWNLTFFEKGATALIKEFNLQKNKFPEKFLIN